MPFQRSESVVLHLDCTVTPIETAHARLLLEFRPIDHQLKAAREEREAVQQQANRELIRNLAHEIKNPLGGIRGSAQLLEHELAPTTTRRSSRNTPRSSSRRPTACRS